MTACLLQLWSRPMKLLQMPLLYSQEVAKILWDFLISPKDALITNTYLPLLPEAAEAFLRQNKCCIRIFSRTMPLCFLWWEITQSWSPWMSHFPQIFLFPPLKKCLSICSLKWKLIFRLSRNLKTASFPPARSKVSHRLWKNIAALPITWHRLWMICKKTLFTSIIVISLMLSPYIRHSLTKAIPGTFTRLFTVSLP